MKNLSVECISPLNNDQTARQELEHLAQSQGQEEPFFVMDVGEVMDKYATWTGVFPDIKPYYAVKCNDSLIVLKTLAALGANFDCASKVEIARVLSVGVSPDRIIFANPVKQQNHIRFAAKVGVDLMTFDNSAELYKIKEHNPNAKLVLRLVADSKDSQCMAMGLKFGARPAEAVNLMRTANNLGLDLVGVSFHVGSGNRDLTAYSRALSQCRDFYDACAEHGVHLSIVDIGGGFTSDDFDKVSGSVLTSLDEYFPAGTGVKIIAEPGRFLVATAYTLATRVHSMRIDRDRPMYYINDGVYGSFNCLLYDHATVAPIPLKGGDGPLYKSSIWGPTCDSLDQVAEDVLLPILTVDDWLVFEAMGAYTLAAASQFNGFPPTKVHHVANSEKWNELKTLVPDACVAHE
ncbi:ornithine [Nesidiocoris tenuis]|uniref:ornithine decarboxylase n=1 Tax=Nesidiocoris tenuis TaxID=355587 RepID=A0ABN7B7H0_9HEMI|nr:ornithine [Nesidiocoris tenuis]